MCNLLILQIRHALSNLAHVHDQVDDGDTLLGGAASGAALMMNR